MATRDIQILQPPGWPKPKGYANGIAARGRLVFIAGMVGWNREGVFESDEFVAQAYQALKNVLETLAEAGGRPEHLVRLTWFVTSKAEYLASLEALGEAYRALMGRHYPAMTVVEVKALLEDRAKVEIEATAVIPE
ncbi:MAG: RidA family protein [Meiothermus sp.]|uniref:RidA family protein n=1 Tax=Meiothermus sp. TaxID=1955249 RepID=UPI0025E79F1A|nr:RidA family protein [Meiothermus sp.]MCS7058259.1 RidA family protein [Meiothermus sp.]MCS7194830.1 RidA family protein [Meiothermus sp.]MCX7741300.1 RidA family protein [Meiothermus sp.]MDW8090362.1 RidA family protein [Meiothermus sp.]MDW8481136.1 RidA family protein [Meiothermus sp.]